VGKLHMFNQLVITSCQDSRVLRFAAPDRVGGYPYHHICTAHVVSCPIDFYQSVRQIPDRSWVNGTNPLIDQSHESDCRKEFMLSGCPGLVVLAYPP
jgi:hypothetical protein